ncbi:MAG TPA: hypothetical protein VEC36_02430 [Patescibacteria group bacterium]|nr:hypothetical protein [Patescibacteria group bacterium]
MKKTRLFLTVYFLMCTVFTHASAQHELNFCWKKQVRPLGENYLEFSFKSSNSFLYHSFEPWQKVTSRAAGIVAIHAQNFVKSDSTISGKKVYFSKVHYDSAQLLQQNYGQTALANVTKSDHQDYLLETARYSPIALIHHFKKNGAHATLSKRGDTAMYSLNINTTFVTLFIRIQDNLLEKITLLNNKDFYGFYGDVLTTITYHDYYSAEGLSFPKTVAINKMDGRLLDTILISDTRFVKSIEPVLKKPETFTWKAETPDSPSKVSTQTFTKNIHFVNLDHSGARSMIVEFKDFLLIANAALTSENGELVLKEAKKIAPQKPVKYFAFGHFHNWYTGGVRAFVHKGTTILCQPHNKDYIQYIAEAPHTIQPDSQQLQPKEIVIQVFKDSLTISDNEFEMKIYMIGSKSEHTNDFSIFYFPSEQLLFEDELMWIDREGAITKANPRQKGLYNAIKDLGLNVKTIVKSWPINNPKVKDIIPFSDLEVSVKIE